jgi:tripartite-type tricarboxylate transporter receptor subunit TctC
MQARQGDRHAGRIPRPLFAATGENRTVSHAVRPGILRHSQPFLRRVAGAWRTLVLLLCLTFLPAAARAEGPLRIVVPAAAGGGTDVIARILADAIAPHLKRPVIVENRVGSGAVVGTNSVAKAAPDGSTVLLATVAHALNPALLGKLPYDSLNDFVPVAEVASVPMVLVVNPSVPATDLKFFLALLRDNPGKYAFGTAGRGTAVHVAVELMKSQAKVDALHVPYKGAGPAMIGVLAGEVQFMVDLVSTATPYIKDGKIRALAATGPVRSALLPDVPTMKEAGLPEYEAYTWNIVIAPKGTPAGVVAELNAAINAGLAEPRVRKVLDDLGVELMSNSTPASTAAFLRSETAKWTAIVQGAGLAQPGQ